VMFSMDMREWRDKEREQQCQRSLERHDPTHSVRVYPNRDLGVMPCFDNLERTSWRAILPTSPERPVVALEG
jgi:hypothetical protein